MTVIPVSDHFVRQIRVAEPQHNVTRVVLDLETPVESTTSRLENPDRLIIELRAPGGELRAQRQSNRNHQSAGENRRHP